MQYVGSHAAEISQCTHTDMHTCTYICTLFPTYYICTVCYNAVGRHLIIMNAVMVNYDRAQQRSSLVHFLSLDELVSCFKYVYALVIVNTGLSRA